MQGLDRYPGVRRDRADFFSTTEEGVKGQRAVTWGLVDEVVPRTKLEDIAKARALLGWEPQVSLETGLRETIAYFQGINAAAV